MALKLFESRITFVSADTTLRATYMVCRGECPSLFDFHGLTAAQLPPPNVSSATARLIAFSLAGYPGKGHLAGCPLPKSDKSGATGYPPDAPTRWGDWF